MRHTPTTDILDRLSPDEAHLPPSARTWARIIVLYAGHDVLEMRDPNDGQDPDPDRKTRYQYLIARDRLWSRRLPPAPLAHPDADGRWMGDSGEPRWSRVDDLRTDSPIAEWASVSQGLPLTGLLPAQPIRSHGQRNPHGTGYERYVLYQMPPGDPWDSWADITSYRGAPVACPVAGCPGELVWYEAGYVPGYRVCMRPLDQGHDRGTIRHHFSLDHDGDGLIQLRRKGWR